MSIKHITGVPGTGKTYFAINDVILRFYKFNSSLVEWQEDTAKTKKPVLIFTNIEQLKLKHINIDTYCTSHDIDIYTFFTVGYWEKNIDFENNQIVIILDEAQKYFPSSYRLHGSPAPDVNPLYFFQYHRHFGVDIYVITQTYDAICRHVVQLSEYEIHAITRVYRLGNNFRYVFRTGLYPDDVIAKKSFRYDKKVGMLYQSFMSDSDDSKRPNPLRKYLFFLAFLIVLGIYLFYNSLSGFQPPDSNQTISKQPETSHRAEDEGGNVLRSVPSTKNHDFPKKDTVQLALPEHQILLTTGGMWVSGKLTAIEFYGDLIPVSDFGFTFYEDRQQRQVKILLPQSLVNQVQIAKNNTYYQDDHEIWHDVEDLSGGDSGKIVHSTNYEKRQAERENLRRANNVINNGFSSQS